MSMLTVMTMDSLGKTLFTERWPLMTLGEELQPQLDSLEEVDYSSIAGN